MLILSTIATTAATSAAAMCGCWIGIQAADAVLKAGGKAFDAIAKGAKRNKIVVKVVNKDKDKK